MESTDKSIQKHIHYLKYKEKYQVVARNRYETIIKPKYIALKAVIYKHYGAYCHCCYEDTVDFLTIEHLNNDGFIDRKIKGLSGLRGLQSIVSSNYPKTYTILCMNCNFAKRNSNQCPHRKTLILQAI